MQNCRWNRLILPLLLALAIWAEGAMASRGPSVIRVQAGDCLWKIARRYGTTVVDLAQANGIKNPHCILAGQKLLIPAGNRQRKMGSTDASRSYVSPAVRTISPPVLRSLQAMVKPVAQGRLSSGYGMRWGRMHRGIDLACPVGTPVRAVAAGQVVSAGWCRGYGWLVELDHGQWRTRYAHNSRLLGRTGDRVEVNQPIALSGATGRATGPHLHFEVIVQGRTINPAPYLNL